MHGPLSPLNYGGRRLSKIIGEPGFLQPWIEKLVMKARPIFGSTDGSDIIGLCYVDDILNCVQAFLGGEVNFRGTLQTIRAALKSELPLQADGERVKGRRGLLWEIAHHNGERRGRGPNQRKATRQTQVENQYVRKLQLQAHKANKKKWSKSQFARMRFR